MVTKKSLIIEKVIGTGGFGSVYRSKYGNETVAVKIIKNKDNGIPFLTELSVMSRTTPKSKYINSAIKTVLRDENIYIIQPIAISDLKSFMEHNYVSLGNKKIGISQITKGLMFLHSNGILHLDIKPGNILVYPEITRGHGQKYIWKLSDFGISKINGYFSPHMVCTSKYRPLDVWLSNKNEHKTPLTPAIDYWSFGCIIHEIIYETPIFESQNKSNKITPKLYQKAILEFNNLIFGDQSKSFPDMKNITTVYIEENNIKYNPPNIKHIKSKNDPISIVLREMLNPIPNRRNIKSLCNYLDLEYIVPTTLNMKDILKNMKYRYSKSGGKKTTTTDLVMEWMCQKLNDPYTKKPDIALYELLLSERNILSTLNYNILS